ncbi:hypothetical protein EDC01DRAFT_635807 [Geopyxis carbonaria]|nr:hypothetical protein EDC01DRAFT_635807 [Geopyxis carbonaria]
MPYQLQPTTKQLEFYTHQEPQDLTNMGLFQDYSASTPDPYIEESRVHTPQAAVINFCEYTSTIDRENQSLDKTHDLESQLGYDTEEDSDNTLSKDVRLLNNQSVSDLHKLPVKVNNEPELRFDNRAGPVKPTQKQLIDYAWWNTIVSQNLTQDISNIIRKYMGAIATDKSNYPCDQRTAKFLFLPAISIQQIHQQ